MARAVIEFKASDLKRSYVLPCGCPIFHALDRAGVPVVRVTPEGFYISHFPGDVHDHSFFTKKLLKASDLLARNSTLKVRRKLLGQRFQVTW
jgi:hypothetical protein